ncbi:GNAT family N-acetyltransferase [Dactylosporangium sp. AC04546]|uniref:GNAT family N-acetyltransferase n=1 Tax=Dactylosporangium sp. AC04546 TaxID=2862460 RepID=UPI001EDCFF03|nr:GNAT family N-acetyltransferase [Dactylosporangium sp. AC04546]WVK84403.1 GNAT family N-acetyltransferase [Dactylosporangium sp. AC04546]
MIVDLAELDTAARIAAEALELDGDSGEARLLVRRLADGPDGRVGFRLVDERGDGVVFGSVSDRDPRLGYVELLAVRASARRRGLGSQLLAAAEDRLRALGCERVRLGGNPPCYAWPGVDVRYTAAVCLAQKRGYGLEDTAWNMTADLRRESDDAERDEKRLAGVGVKVMEAPPETSEWVRSIWGDGWAWEVGQSIGRDGAGCYVAVRDGEILGFAAYGANRPSWFGPMGTAPAAEGLGVGRVLLRRCLADQRANRHDTAQIGWAGPIAFYSKAVGARIERIFWIYGKAL